MSTELSDDKFVLAGQLVEVIEEKKKLEEREKLIRAKLAALSPDLSLNGYSFSMRAGKSSTEYNVEAIFKIVQEKNLIAEFLRVISLSSKELKKKENSNMKTLAEANCVKTLGKPTLVVSKEGKDEEAN